MGKLKALVGVLVVFGGFFYAWNMIPPYFHRSQFQDELDDIARRASYSSISEDDLKRMVIIKAQTDDLPPLKEDQITVVKGAGTVSISVHYRVHVDMIVYQTDLDFIANSHNKVITG
ncbi:MAG TPA: hypothetical protein VI488_09860 [Candidatus Angelobacter sp.]